MVLYKRVGVCWFEFVFNDERIRGTTKQKPKPPGPASGNSPSCRQMNVWYHLESTALVPRHSRTTFKGAARFNQPGVGDVVPSALLRVFFNMPGWRSRQTQRT